jgi:transcription elongation GreA/GreB family factor
MHALKLQLIQHLQQILESNEIAIKNALSVAKESRDGDTKSSAGDKYETGRAMMQIEIDKFENQLQKTRVLQKELERINLDRTFNEAVMGSIVQTNTDFIFISIGLGRIVLNGQNYITISQASPLGQAIYNKKKGEKFSLNGRENDILGIW